MEHPSYASYHRSPCVGKMKRFQMGTQAALVAYLTSRASLDIQRAFAEGWANGRSSTIFDDVPSWYLRRITIGLCPT